MFNISARVTCTHTHSSNDCFKYDYVVTLVRLWSLSVVLGPLFLLFKCSPGVTCKQRETFSQRLVWPGPYCLALPALKECNHFAHDRGQKTIIVE